MRIAYLLGILPMAVAAGCEGGPAVGAASSALGTDRWAEAPAWVDGAGASASEHRDGWTLVRGPVQAAPPATDIRPPVPMAVLREDGAALLPPAPVVDAALLALAVAWVGAEGELWIDHGAQPRPVDDGVVGELAVDPSGHRLAYAKPPGADAGVWIVAREEGTPRRLTAGLAVADRPLFVDDGMLVVAGARPGGIAGLWLVHADGAMQPRAITNGTLRAGRPLGPTFVPPPAHHDSMRVDGDVLVYHDGEVERRVSLAEVLR